MNGWSLDDLWNCPTDVYAVLIDEVQKAADTPDDDL